MNPTGEDSRPLTIVDYTGIRENMPPKFQPRARKQKARKAANDLQAKHSRASDSNVAQILPEDSSDKNERRAQLRAELDALRISSSKTSSKKRKRLDKYVETKLRKEENADLIRKLEQHKVDTSLLQSSKKLGRASENRREAASQALKEQRAGIIRPANDALYQRKRAPDDTVSDDSEENNGFDEESDPDASLPEAEANPREKVQPAFGTGLKRPLQLDSDGNPVIKRKQRKKQKIAPALEATSDDWEGFSDESDASDRGGVALPLTRTADEMESPDESDLGDSDVSTADTDGTRSSEDEDEEAYDSDEDGEEPEEESDDSEDDQDGREAAKEARHERSSAFKDWALQLRNNAAGFTPSHVISENSTPDPVAGQVYKNKTEPVGLPQMSMEKRTHSVIVDRSAAIQEARSQLPVVAEEQRIMEAIISNDTTIICGATGSGKTTQVPQFLFEAGYGDRQGPTPGMIAITQPRRVAAVSMAKRVATELGSQDGKVSHQIRFDSTVSNKTAIKFMTDGVLLREVSQDFTLSKYSAVIVDEAHERSVNTDLLIGMLSRIVETRAKLSKDSPSKHRPLKLIIMSATLRVNDFTSNTALFRHGPPPVIQAEGRQYPVTTHFARRTQRDYVEETFHKVSKGHRKLPPGGILVFLTGQTEIQQLAKRLYGTFSSTSIPEARHARTVVSAASTTIEDEDIDLGATHRDDDGYDSDIEIRGVDDPEEDAEFEIEDGQTSERLKVHILPLYSQLPTEQQMRVFEPAPDGSRMVVLATNIAETSLTIPGIRYVFDSGRAKEKNFDKQTGVQSFDVGWISKAAANQRAGRAGRTGPGHCYRLYSSAVYERDFAEFSAPEIERTPIEGVVLQLKSMGIPSIVHFPFPTPPDRESLLKAERLLEYMSALKDGKVTATGADIALYPLSPRLARIIVMSRQHGCLQHAVALVAALAVQEVFVHQSQQLEPGDGEPGEVDAGEDERKRAFSKFHGNAARLDRHSDAIKLLATFMDYLAARDSPSTLNELGRFVRVKALQEALQLRDQLSAIIAAHHPGSMSSAIPSASLPKPSAQQVKILRQIVAAGFIDQIAIRADKAPNAPEVRRKSRRTIEVPYLTLFPSYDEADVDARMRTEDSEGRAQTQQERFVFIHPSSVLAHVSMDKLPQFLVYSHLSRGSPSSIAGSRTPKTRLHPLAPVSAAQIAALAEGTPLIEEGKPVGQIETLPRGDDGLERRTCWVVRSVKGPVGSMGWPLPPATKVMQKRVAKRGWVVEKVLQEGKSR